MNGPAQAGLFIYANNLQRTVKFYEAVAQMTRIHEKSDLIVLQSKDIQLLVHKIPAHIAKDIVISSPPIKRDNTALKLFFTVPSLNEASLIAKDFGGEIYDENWHGIFFRRK